MAITTLSELVTAISDRYARADITSTVAYECIAMAEARMQRQLRTIDMETKTANLSIADEYVPVPIDFLGVRDFYVNGATRQQLSMRSPEYLTTQYPDGGSGVPKFYAILGGEFKFAPVPSGDASIATLTYYAKIPALSTTNTQNWLLRDHPDAYLYGALTEVAIRFQDQAAATGYGNLFSAALDSIESHNNRKRYTGPALTVTPG